MVSPTMSPSMKVMLFPTLSSVWSQNKEQSSIIMQSEKDFSTADLKKHIGGILKDVDLETTSAKKVRMQLEKDLDIDLTDRKEEIVKLIQDVINEMEDNDNDDKKEESEDEKPEKKSKKSKGGDSSEEDGEKFLFDDEKKEKKEKRVILKMRRRKMIGRVKSPRNQEKMIARMRVKMRNQRRRRNVMTLIQMTTSLLLRKK